MIPGFSSDNFAQNLCFAAQTTATKRCRESHPALPKFMHCIRFRHPLDRQDAVIGDNVTGRVLLFFVLVHLLALEVSVRHHLLLGGDRAWQLEAQVQDLAGVTKARTARQNSL